MTAIAMPKNAVKPLRTAVWGGAGLLLLLPLVAMQFTREVNWSGSDFVVFGGMLLVACTVCELALRASGSWAYRLAVAIAVGASFLMTWANLAVGIVGNENNPVNRWYSALLALLAVGALLVRGRPRGMAMALTITALAQLVLAIAVRLIALADTWVFTAVFMAAWMVAAQLFLKSASSVRQQ